MGPNGSLGCWTLVPKLWTREAPGAYYGDDGPEVLTDFETYGAASNIWSLGRVITYYMRKGKHVFNCNDDVLFYRPRMASDMIFNKKSTNNYSSTLVQLVCSMIQVLKVLLVHPFIDLNTDQAWKATNSQAGVGYVQVHL